MIATLLTNLIPLYIIIAAGFVAGKWLNVSLSSLAATAIFILTPVVMFGAIAQLSFEKIYLLLPVIIIFISALCAFSSFLFSRKSLPGTEANLVAMAVGTGNTGYFGLPIIMSLFGAEAIGIYLLMNFGIIISENTICYYMGARGHFSLKESLLKIARLPAIHATWLGLLFNFFSIPLPDVFTTYWEHFTGAWIVIGMMLVGVALAKVEKFHLNLKLMVWLFAFRFMAWPALTFAFVLADKLLFGFYDEKIYIMMILMGTVPLAANTVAFAEHLKLSTDDAATAVLLTTLFAVLFMPLIFWLVV